MVQKPPSLHTNDFVDKYYVENIRDNEDSLIDFKILHLTDLQIDNKYMAGTSSDCRNFRCCHLDKNGELESSNSANIAGPFGSRNCDMPLNGARVLLTRLKEELIAEYGEINMVVVTGNVVSD